MANVSCAWEMCSTSIGQLDDGAYSVLVKWAGLDGGLTREPPRGHLPWCNPVALLRASCGRWACQQPSTLKKICAGVTEWIFDFEPTPIFRARCARCCVGYHDGEVWYGSFGWQSCYCYSNNSCGESRQPISFPYSIVELALGGVLAA